MTQYTEEIQTNVTIKHDGNKEVKTVTVLYKDGEYHSSSNHRSLIMAEDDVPQDIADFIEAKKGKQPKKDKDKE